MTSWSESFKLGFLMAIFSLFWLIVGIIVALIISEGAVFALFDPKTLSDPSKVTNVLERIQLGGLLGIVIFVVGTFASIAYVILDYFERDYGSLKVLGSFCPNCGRKIKEVNAKFCPFCGFKLKRSGRKRISKKRKNVGKPVSIDSIALAAIKAIFYSFALLFGNIVLSVLAVFTRVPEIFLNLWFFVMVSIIYILIENFEGQNLLLIAYLLGFGLFWIFTPHLQSFLLIINPFALVLIKYFSLKWKKQTS